MARVLRFPTTIKARERLAKRARKSANDKENRPKWEGLLQSAVFEAKSLEQEIEEMEKRNRKNTGADWLRAYQEVFLKRLERARVEIKIIEYEYQLAKTRGDNKKLEQRKRLLRLQLDRIRAEKKLITRNQKHLS